MVCVVEVRCILCSVWMFGPLSSDVWVVDQDFPYSSCLYLTSTKRLEVC